MADIRNTNLEDSTSISNGDALHRRCGHIDKLQAGDDKRAVKILVKNPDADNSVIRMLKAKLAKLEVKLEARRYALAYAPRVQPLYAVN